MCDDLGFSKIKTRVTRADISKIEKDFGITVNLFGHKKDDISVIYQTSTKVDINQHVDLLVTSEENGNEVKSHYVWIKDFNKLCHNQSKHDGKKYFVEIACSVLVVMKCCRSISQTAWLFMKHKQLCYRRIDQY